MHRRSQSPRQESCLMHSSAGQLANACGNCVFPREWDEAPPSIPTSLSPFLRSPTGTAMQSSVTTNGTWPFCRFCCWPGRGTWSCLVSVGSWAAWLRWDPCPVPMSSTGALVLTLVLALHSSSVNEHSTSQSQGFNSIAISEAAEIGGW